MSRIDRWRRAPPEAVITGVMTALLALAAGADESTPADGRLGDAPPTEERAIETRPDDGLGASRLFFTAKERHAMTHGESGGSPGQPWAGEAPDGEREPGAVPDRRTAGPVRTSEPDGIAFQALLHADDRAQVVLGGRLCRAELPAGGRAAGDAAPLALRCAAMPAGVRAVQLLRQEKRLLITLSDGGHRRLALGESVVSP